MPTKQTGAPVLRAQTLLARSSGAHTACAGWCGLRAEPSREERVAAHVGPDSRYSKEIGLVKAGKVALQPVEVKELVDAGRIAGKKVLHLMCHIGTDTISLKHAGAASVTGLDFSGKALAEAARLAAEAGLSPEEARWVESDVYSAPVALGGERFDVVFLNVGSLCWLSSVTRWAAVVRECLAPGGTFYIRDGHPMLFTLADEDTPGFMARPRDEHGGRDLLVTYPYFETIDGTSFDSNGTYADPNAKFTSTVTHEWNHSLGEIVTALVTEGGLQIEFLHEHDRLDWRMIDTMHKDEDSTSLGFGGYQWPEHQRNLCPMMFSIRATSPRL